MTKKNLILGGALLALILLAYAYQGPLKKWQADLGRPKNIFAAYAAGQPDKIEVNSDKQRVVLEKDGANDWRVDLGDDFYAAPAVLAKIFNELAAAAGEELELVSNNSERKGEFKTDNSGLAVKLYSRGKITADLIIGAPTADQPGTYVSTPGSSATYAVRADLAGVFNPPEWRDETIFSVEKDKINKIRFQYPSREFTVELKDGKWQGTLPEKFAVSADKIEPVLDIMTGLKAAAIPAQDFSGTGLEKHLIIVEASGEGVDNVLMIGGPKSDLYYAKRGDSDNIYLITKEQRAALDKSSWQLR